jgi:Ca-activated chloride channel family protein
VTLRGKIGEEEKKFSESLQFEKEETNHEFIPRLWATRRVGFLLEEIRHHGENGELKEEVTQLARQYGIVTPYTSYLVTEDQPILLGSSPTAADASTRSFYRKSLGRMPQEKASRPERERLLRAQANDQSGDAAVAGARFNYSLKSVENAQQLAEAPAEVQLYVNTGRLESRAGKPLASMPQIQAQQYVGQRTFQMENGFWNETSTMGANQQPAVKIEFDSKEYWDLVSKNPELKDVLALGTQVRFLLNNKIYEVYSKNI